MEKKPNILLTHYQDTEKWTIVNDFEIHEDGVSSDRHKIQTKVPRSLSLDLKDIRVVSYCRWSGDEDDDDWVGVPKYIQASYITARAEIYDRITVFSIEEGALLQFEEIACIVIHPISSGKVGGKENARAWSGTRNAPEKGLMEGEPGVLFSDEDGFSLGRDGSEEPILVFELYLDKPQFKSLCCTLLTNLERVEGATMVTAVEVFQDAMEASYNEPGMRNEYGLLKRDDVDFIVRDGIHFNSVEGRARIDHISITYSSPTPVPPPAVEVDDEEVEPLGRQEPHFLINTDDQLAKTMRSVRTRLDWVIGLLVLLIISLIAAM